jgi:hypothetical protein
MLAAAAGAVGVSRKKNSDSKTRCAAMIFLRADLLATNFHPNENEGLFLT